MQLYINGEGRIGKLSEPLSFEEIKEKLNQELSEVPAREFNKEKIIKNIATLTGAGAFTHYLKEAKHLNTDLYITGETSLYLLE